MSDGPSRLPPKVTNVAQNDASEAGMEQNGGNSKSPSEGDILPTAVVEKLSAELKRSGLTPEKAHPLARRLGAMVTTYSGPLPPAREFEGYERTCPGAARDILEMAKSNLAHRQHVDLLRARGDIALKLAGMSTVALIVAALVGGAAFVAMEGHDYVAAVIGGGAGLAGIVVGVARMLTGTDKAAASPPPPKLKPRSRRR